jgi:glutamine synthetase
VRQALRRAGFHATFVCLPPFPEAMASGWHLHQSLVDGASGANAFRREAPAAGSGEADAGHTLSAIGESWLAGLLAHGRAMTPFCAPTLNGYGRFRPNAMAPNAVIWGRDHRGAMLRVLGRCGDAATRIENRIGEPAANPYLYMAAQIHAGLDGIERGLRAPPATGAPYAGSPERLPASLAEALDALAADPALVAGFGPGVVDWLTQVKRFEIGRHAAAADQSEWQAREYFGRI